MKQQVKRNIVVFEAPLELTEKTKQIAEDFMCSPSAIYRRALSQYISTEEKRKVSEQLVPF
jgi:predicted transcriptional regulator